MDRKFKLALCQTPCAMEKETNVSAAEQYIADAAAGGADIVMLPEMFNTPYSNRYFRAFSEPAGGPTWQRLSKAAKKNGVWLIGGSIPEIEDDRVYNTCFIFNNEGEQVGRHRKVHLFDVCIEGGINFQESKTLTAGNERTVFDTPWGRMGVIICFDIRFAEFAMKYACEGVDMLFVPAAFNMTTGPLHWERSFRARATDGQFFMAGCAPARDENFLYISYAHSLVTSPWGELLVDAGTEAGITFCDIDLAFCDKVRRELPILSARKPEMY